MTQVSPSSDSAPDEALAAHGVLHVGTGAPVSTESLFQIGSITKVWTASLVMQLADSGALDLDAPVVEVVPSLELSSSARAVTTRHLLSHTSGLEGDIFTDTGRGDDCVARYVEELRSASQMFTREPDGRTAIPGSCSPAGSSNS
ncbi:serine hydrolase domain-containing protein [Microbacterium sp. NIBRBAC000506063]|uniref:serine hydrolase domain-containing protein n=1 Tax=Microbacterium sp. NIBRBAC000506063 TaxID=2734618 RepID=UPI001BB4E6E6|nr:serine hydrolase domain-containing protein [Microbacterium sp. NIBRBAC000506063]QTV79594.1 beta-lactamase family protein [Microbacterium sp. NIBRBAC000506063]